MVDGGEGEEDLPVNPVKEWEGAQEERFFFGGASQGGGGVLTITVLVGMSSIDGGKLEHRGGGACVIVFGRAT